MKSLAAFLALATFMGCSGVSQPRASSLSSGAAGAFMCHDIEKYWANFDSVIMKSQYTTNQSDTNALKVSQVKAFNKLVNTLQNTGERDPQKLDQFVFGSVEENGKTYQFVGWVGDFRYNDDTPDSQVVFFAYDTTSPVGFYFSDTDRNEHQCYGQSKLAAQLVKYSDKTQ